MKTTTKMNKTLKINDGLKRKHYLNTFLRTSQLDSLTTTDVKPEMLSGVQTGNGIPHYIYDIRGIAHACTNRKDNIFMQRRLGQIFTCTLEWGQGTCKKSRPNPARAYTT